MILRTESRLTGVVVLSGALLAGCLGGGGSEPAAAPAAPSGLTEHDSTVVYAVGNEIVPDTPASSGGTIERYSVSPALPPGLSMDSRTGTITGTPTAVTRDTVYTVTGSNGAGNASTRLEIEVKADVVAPETLNYPETSVVYIASLQIKPNTPVATGGEITLYSVSPDLPAGLALDAKTGVITGTPAQVTASAVYTVTGSNSADSVDTQVTIEVAPLIVAPTSLAYADPSPVYIVGESIVDNEPESAGGEIASFSISPPLPAGLSLNTQTGMISGTPATATASSTLYTVTGSNDAGSVTAQLTIDVENAVIGEWLPTDSLNHGRFRHTATLLADGRVLAAGGARKSVSSSAEIYDPGAGTWTEAASLGQARQSHTATLLRNGQVLVAGGFGAGGGTQTASAELFDPATGSWSSTGSMNLARDSHTATLLSNGMVLVAGGDGKRGPVLASAELYDPATGTWTSTGSLAQGRDRHVAALLADGRVLVIGGNGSGGRLSSAELYDPTTGTWTPTANMNQARSSFDATLLSGGQVLVTGGLGQDALASAELYDPATGQWSLTGSLRQARYQHSATRLPDGRVLAAGAPANPAS